MSNEENNSKDIIMPEVKYLDDPGGGLGSRDQIFTIARRLMAHNQGKIQGGWSEKLEKFVGKFDQGGLREKDALYAAQFATSRGLNPFGDIHIWYIKGQVIVDIHWRILKGWAEMITPFRTETVDMTSEEREKHGLAPDDLGVIAYNIADSDADFYRVMLLTFIQKDYSASEAKREAIALVAKGRGIGILRKNEMKKDPPKGRSWYWRCKIRAGRDATGQSHGNPTVVQIRDFARGRITTADLPVLTEPIMAELNPPEQQRYLELHANQREAKAKWDAMTPKELHAESQANINLMRGTIEDEETPLGEEPDREEISEGVVIADPTIKVEVIEAEPPAEADVKRYAKIMGGFNWGEASRQLAEACPVYQLENGKPNMTLILTTAWDNGFKQIHKDNFGDVLAKLSDVVNDDK